MDRFLSISHHPSSSYLLLGSLFCLNLCRGKGFCFCLLIGLLLRISPCSIGKSSSEGPCSIAMLVYQSVSLWKKSLRGWSPMNVSFPTFPLENGEKSGTNGKFWSTFVTFSWASLGISGLNWLTDWLNRWIHPYICIYIYLNTKKLFSGAWRICIILCLMSAMILFSVLLLLLKLSCPVYLNSMTRSSHQPTWFIYQFSTSAAFSASSTSSRFGILIQKDSWGPTSLKQKPFSETSNSSDSNTISPEIFEKSMYTWTFKGVPIEPFGMVNWHPVIHTYTHIHIPSYTYEFTMQICKFISWGCSSKRWWNGWRDPQD